MEALEFEERKKALLEECGVASPVFQQVEQRLEEFLEPFAASLVRREQVAHVRTFVSGLLSDLKDRNVESIAYRFGQERLPLQHFIGASEWDDRALRDELARQIGRELGEPDGVLVFDPSGFPKSGRESVGVARQWCGRLGKVDNCQVAVFLGYVSSVEHALVDTRLYLPKEWTSDKKRMAKAGVPKGEKYRTRHQLALELLAQHGPLLPHAWIAGDDEMGRPTWFRRRLRELEERYLLAVPSNTLIRDLAVQPPVGTGRGRPPQRPWQRVADWAQAQPDAEWIALDVRDGSKGPLLVELLATRVKARNERQRESADEETLVVIRYRDRESRDVTKSDYYLSNASADTAPAEFARAAKAEHRIEECLQRAKSEAGLADYEVRNWIGWQHHQTLSLIATWFLVQETRRGKKMHPRHHAAPDSRRHFPDPLPRLGMRYSITHRARLPTPPGAQRTGAPLPLEKT
jgi:SRSO17 transposase